MPELTNPTSAVEELGRRIATLDNSIARIKVQIQGLKCDLREAETSLTDAIRIRGEYQDILTRVGVA